MLKVNLVRSLKKQDTDYELILVDNRKNKFRSLPKALNYGGSKAQGEYLMFVHQDVELIGSSWLRTAEKILATLVRPGAFGVAGGDSNGNPVGFIIDRGRLWGSPIRNPKPAMTLDEQLIIVPRGVFSTLKFDEEFKWHSYAADYCLSIQSRGLKTYVLPLPVSHNSPTLPIRKIAKIENDDLKLWIKHGKKNSVIYKTTSTISPQRFMSYKIRERARSFVHPLVSLLKSVRNKVIYGKYNRMLDIVVPAEQPYIKEVKSSTSYSVGVSDKIQYLLASKKISVHDDYVHASLENLPFREGVFDIVIVRSVLEYLPKHEGERLLNALERIGHRLVVVIPNNGFPRTLFCRYYRSIWRINELKNKDYKVHGLIPRIRFQNTAEIWFNYVAKLISWYLPWISGILIAVKRIM